MERKQFTRSKPALWVEFDVDGDTFRAVSSAPAVAVLDAAAINSAEGIDRLVILMRFLDMVLEPASAIRFAARTRSSENPITLEQTAEIAVWLLEEVYGPERPTQAPSPSQDGSGSTGTSTTGTATTGASTPGPQTQPAL
jgi:hypothetical protein